MSMSYTYSNINMSTVPYTISSTGALGTAYTLNSLSNGTVSVTNDVSNTLNVKGDAQISGSLKVGGKDIAESLERIEERLAILRPNEELEEKWEKLRGLRKAYMELEAEINEKEQIWSILKK